MCLLVAEAAGNGWRLEQGDLDSPFLNGRCLGEDRLVYFRVPRRNMGGQHWLPAPSLKPKRQAMA